MHKPNRKDVDRALLRYVTITGDDTAKIVHHEGPLITWEADGIFENFYGAASALKALEMYCLGYGHGQEEGRAQEAAELLKPMA